MKYVNYILRKSRCALVLVLFPHQQWNIPISKNAVLISLSRMKLQYRFQLRWKAGRRANYVFCRNCVNSQMNRTPPTIAILGQKWDCWLRQTTADCVAYSHMLLGNERILKDSFSLWSLVIMAWLAEFAELLCGFPSYFAAFRLSAAFSTQPLTFSIILKRSS